MDFRLIPISGDALEWQCSVLKLAGLTVLLDCGWSESLDPELLEPLRPHLPELDLIVLTHADTKHVGAVPYLLTKYSVTCPIVSTEPISRLGELACVACLEDREKYRAPADGFDVDDVLRTFMSRVTPLKYRETFFAQVRGRTLAVCPYPAGHHLGSAYWTLQAGGLSALYLVDFDLRESRFLDGLDLQKLTVASRGAGQPFDVLITAPLPTLGGALATKGVQEKPQEASGATKALTVARNVREQLLLEGTIATLRRGGSVLIPADVTGSVPELLLLLDAAWEQDRQLSRNYPLVWLSSMGDMVLDQVKTRLEWMSKEVLENFETRLGTNPFVLKNVRIFQTLEELCAAHPLSRPKVVITTSQRLDGGDSRELFTRLCAEPRSLVWLLGVPVRNTLGRQLFDDFVLNQTSRKEYRLQTYFNQPLPEEQLRAYYESKVQELIESGRTLPPELARFAGEDFLATKAEEADIDDAALGVGELPKPEGAAAAGKGKASADAKGAAAALWSPPGWPGSRTIPHTEVRGEGDGYGHFLSPAEKRAWKAQDQGSDRYGMTGDGDEADGTAAKEEPSTKMEDDAALGAESSVLDWRESLRVHFPEPMSSEVRERTVRVSCRIRHLPDTTMDPQDLLMLIRTTGPKHVVLLPTADDFVTGEVLTKQFKHANLNGNVAPQVHILRPRDPAVELSLRVPKRRLQFSSDLWTKLSFFKAENGVRVARVRASRAEGPGAAANAERGIFELVACKEPAESSSKPASDGNGAADTTLAKPTREERLPRTSALLVASGDEPVTLSGLKEQLRRAEWTTDVPVEFKRPRARTGKPWSARVLDVGEKASLGWASPLTTAASAGVPSSSSLRLMRLEGMPSEEFYAARKALYKRCAMV